MNPGHLVETYRFWDVAALWAREAVQHETVTARALARGIVCDGLRMESTDPAWLPAGRPLRGQPFVGYVATVGARPLILRADVLTHLLAVVHRAAEPGREALHELFVARGGFRDWLTGRGLALPGFWFSPAERAAAAR